MPLTRYDPGRDDAKADSGRSSAPYRLWLRYDDGTEEPGRETARAADLLEPRRSAHATIRGYLYQACLGVLRWLDLREGELLLSEGDEDLDWILLAEGAARVCEQVKHYERALNLVDRPVKASLACFLHAFLARRRRGEEVRFVFTTTARRREQRKGGFDALATWGDATERERVVEALREMLRAECGDEVAWLDSEPGRWAQFLDAVERDFEAPDLMALEGRIQARLRDLSDLPGELLAERLLGAVLETSSRAEAGLRLLDRTSLERVLAATERELEAWSAGKVAERIRDAFAVRVAELLVPGHRPLERPPLPGELLLLPAQEVTPFYGREQVLADLEAWWAAEADAAVMTIAGPGGSGKTRLLVEWVKRLRARGELAGFLSLTARDDSLDLLFGGRGPRLIVLDYAETRLGLVEDLLARMAERRDAARPVRLMLLAREAGEWWERLGGDGAIKRSLVRHHGSAHRLEALLGRVEARVEVFESAARAFAGRTGRAVPEARAEELRAHHFEHPLFVQMAALAAVGGKRIEDETELLDETLEHERRFWRRALEQRRLDVGEVRRALEAADRLVALFTLRGGAASEAEARRLVEQGTELVAAAPALVTKLLDALGEYYGVRAASGRRSLRGLEPDLLGEHLVAGVLARAPAVLDAVLDVEPADRAKSVLTVLTRLADRRPAERRWLEAVLCDRVDALADVAVDVALETGDPIGMVLAECVQDRATGETAERVMKQLDDQHWDTVALRELAVAASARVLATSRARWREPDETQQGELARINSNLGVRLGALGRREEALEATREAVEEYRKLAEARPDAFLPDLATSLNNLGNWLSELGRHEEALEATREAVEEYRKLAEARPDAFLPYLAMSLSNLGIRLSALGRREEALEATREAVEILRPFCLRLPAAFAAQMRKTVGNYQQGAREAGLEPDAALLEPILALLGPIPEAP